MLNIRVVQPRMVPLKDAAAYVGLTAKRFPLACSVRPISMPGNVELYDMRDLDTWLDQMKAGSIDADEEILRKLR